MFEITDCRNIAPERLCSAVNDAFSDYVVPLTMSAQSFRDFQRQRGFSPEHSFVALSGDKIAGFWFSSKPLETYGNRAYTLSVGTSPCFRRQGISSLLFQAVAEKLTGAGAAGMQLEVISNNTGAIATYEKLGFAKVSTLGIFKLPVDGLKPSPDASWTVTPATVDELPSDETAFFDIAPTPQNSRAAITRLAAKTHMVIARDSKTCLGWGAAYADGSVAQIAVHKDHRRNRRGTELLAALAKQTSADQLTFVNVDTQATDLTAFLQAIGGEEVLQQHGMHLSFEAQ